MPDDPTRITPLLERAHEGDENALNEVARLVQTDLLKIARNALRRAGVAARGTVTLDPQDLVNETFVRLLRQKARWQNRGHFFAIATRIMLRVLADFDRSRRRAKRDAVKVQLSLGALGREGAVEPPDFEIGRISSALEALEDLEPRAGRVAKLKVLWGMDNDEVALVMNVSRSTIDRDWRFARTWLRTRLLG